MIMKQNLSTRRYHCCLGLVLLSACSLTALPDPLATGPGSAAADFLRHEGHSNLTIEVDFLGGLASSSLVRDVVLRELDELLDKPGDINLVIDQPFRDYVPRPGGMDEQEAADLMELLRDHGTLEDTASIYVLYMPGYWHQDDDARRVLGVTLGPRSFALFPQAIHAVCRTGVAQIEDPEIRDMLCPLTEAATWLHEFGHILGLVNQGVPMVNDHQDEAYGHHCDNEHCIMHWSHESGDVARFIERRLQEGKTDLEIFDADCQADLKAFR